MSPRNTAFAAGFLLSQSQKKSGARHPSGAWHLVAGEVRLALLGEGREALDRVGAREELAELVRLGVEGARREVDEPLRKVEGERALGGELVCRLERAVEHRVGDRADEADPEGFLRADGAPGEDQILRDADAADTGESLRAAPAWDDAEVDLRLPELCSTRREADVTGECELAAAAEREAVDRCDRRL